MSCALACVCMYMCVCACLCVLVCVHVFVRVFNHRCCFTRLPRNRSNPWWSESINVTTVLSKFLYFFAIVLWSVVCGAVGRCVMLGGSKMLV
jgi:hypothetical protein